MREPCGAAAAKRLKAVMLPPSVNGSLFYVLIWLGGVPPVNEVDFLCAYDNFLRVMSEELPGRPRVYCGRIHDDRTIRIPAKDSARVTLRPVRPEPSSSAD